ncbi:MAG: segregation/condensation protein A [bacterium]
MSHYLHLDVFEGPLDLLLHLIKKSNLDIMDISISDITREYTEYIEIIQKLNLENAGEFLVMAATLMQIKARMLVPVPEKEADEGPDPRADLIAKLLEYKKYKEAAHILSDKYAINRGVHYRTEPEFSQDEYLLEANIFDLLSAFKNILSAASAEVKEIMYEDIPIEIKIRDILTLLGNKEYIMFDDIFTSVTSRAGIIASFLAILELIRTKQIIARQAAKFKGIRIYHLTHNEASVKTAQEIHETTDTAAEHETPETADHAEEQNS